jgi:hypothetical protein
VLLFADQREDGHVSGAGENFHCWVEADGWMIDFMAPAFADRARDLSVSPKVWQRPLSAMASSINDLDRSGDLFCRHEPQAMARHFAEWPKHAAIGYLALVAAKWFRKLPKHMPASISIAASSGDTRDVPLVGRALEGAC